MGIETKLKVKTEKMARLIALALFASVTVNACPWDKGMDEVVQSCSTCLDVNFDDLESQLGVVLGSFCREIQEAGCCSKSTRAPFSMYKRSNPILSLYRRSVIGNENANNQY